MRPSSASSPSLGNHRPTASGGMCGNRTTTACAIPWCSWPTKAILDCRALAEGRGASRRTACIRRRRSPTGREYGRSCGRCGICSVRVRDPAAPIIRAVVRPRRYAVLPPTGTRQLLGPPFCLSHRRARDALSTCRAYCGAHITTRSGPSPSASHPLPTIWSRTAESVM